MTTDPGSQGHIEVQPYHLAPATLITARSYLVDRIVPDCETILLPGKSVPGGQLRYRRVEGIAAPGNRARRSRWLSGLTRTAPAQPVALQDGIGIDLRVNSPQNWAHFLTNHTPLVFVLADALGLPPERMICILPTDIPAYVLRAADLLGLRVQLSDGPVQGDCLAFDLDNWNVLRPLRRDWLVQLGAVDRIARSTAAIDPTAGAVTLPRRVFLARRKTRAIANQPEVEALLSTHGFVTIYPEDLDAALQFRLFDEAEVIVAVHGAGLAPLLYRQPGSRLRLLIQILPCGHMTDVFRVMAQQVGCDWIGVRGRMKPAYVAPAYRLGQPFTEYSLDNFEVDPVSIQRAIESFTAIW